MILCKHKMTPVGYAHNLVLLCFDVVISLVLVNFVDTFTDFLQNSFLASGNDMTVPVADCSSAIYRWVPSHNKILSAKHVHISGETDRWVTRCLLFACIYICDVSRVLNNVCRAYLLYFFIGRQGVIWLSIMHFYPFRKYNSRPLSDQCIFAMAVRIWTYFATHAPCRMPIDCTYIKHNR